MHAGPASRLHWMRMRTGDELLHVTSKLDARYHLMRGEVERSKETTLLEIARLLKEAGTPYALIGGVAVQFHSKDPRTTIDIDLAVLDPSAIPRQALEGSGFRKSGTFEHTENWIGPDGTPVQFTVDPEYAGTIRAAEPHRLGSTEIRIARPLDLVRTKLRAAADDARRKSKRVQDLADAIRLVEDNPAIRSALTEAERARLERL
jgi:hypothetical protein